MRLFSLVRSRKEHRGVDLISDALPFGRLWHGEPDAISNAVDYASSTAVHTMPAIQRRLKKHDHQFEENCRWSCIFRLCQNRKKYRQAGLVHHECSASASCALSRWRFERTLNARLRSPPAQRSSRRRSNFRCIAIWSALYAKPNDALDYAKFFSRSHDAVIRVFD